MAGSVREFTFEELPVLEGASIKVGALKLTERFSNRAPQIQTPPGFEPAQAVSVAEVCANKGIVFRWPKELSAEATANPSAAGDLVTKFTIGAVQGGKAVTLVTTEAPYSGNEFKFAFYETKEMVFCGEYILNKFATFEKMQWSVQIVARKPPNPDVVLWDSSTYGSCDFVFEPTKDFMELYDLAKDPQELNNLFYADGMRSTVETLESQLLRELPALYSDHKAPKAQPDPSQKQKEDFRSLGYI
jgi:hypothetical protein